jgi:GSH-dependent disulfide-bond oxidoreductase
MIELFGMSSPNVTKIIIALEELGLEYRLHYVDVMRKRIGAIAGLSPFGKVPVIVDRSAGDLAVFESGAILIYLAETYRGEALLPSSGPARYAILQWLAAQIAAVGPYLGQNNHFRALKDADGSYAALRYAEHARRIYRVLDDRLSAAPWLGGETYSIADIATHPWAAYVPRHGLQWSDYPALKAWWDRVGERPAVARAHAASAAAFGARDFEAVTTATPAELDQFFWREQPGGPAADFLRTPQAD